MSQFTRTPAVIIDDVIAAKTAFDTEHAVVTLSNSQRMKLFPVYSAWERDVLAPLLDELKAALDWQRRFGGRIAS